ncbi:ABC transporter permease [Companilactobacillus sp. HBUAS56257]|uniref:ABC transporter permease n=1 Tax=Companilactobacillus sp. HBUAS56257 TaxID=3109360 RepID=UPI002FEF2C82
MMINRLISLTQRNIKVFYRDKSRLIFSLFSPAIVLVLYEVFLKQNMINEFTQAFSSLSLSDSRIEGLVQSWIISGALYLTTLSAAAAAINGYSYDRIEKRFDDFFVTPISRFELALSYLLSTMIVTFVVTMTLYLVSLIVLGKYLFFSLEIIEVIFLESLLSSAILSFFSMVFVHSEGGATTVVSLVNSLGGFFAGVYISFGTLGTTLVNILGCLPFAQGSTLFRYQFMNAKLEEILSTIPSNMRLDVKEKVYSSLGISIKVFDKSISITGIQIIALFLIIILTILASISLTRKKD